MYALQHTTRISLNINVLYTQLGKKLEKIMKSYIQIIGICIVGMSLISCATMPREKLKNAFSDVYVGNSTSEVLKKLRQRGLSCHSINDLERSMLRVGGDKVDTPVPNGVVFYQCAVETSSMGCLHTGGVRFVSENKKISRIVQRVYRAKVCM